MSILTNLLADPSFILLLLALLKLHYSAQQASALTCYCNVCGLTVDNCTTSPDSQSTCFKSVEKVLDKENRTFVQDATFGCISGGEGLLAPLQCFVNTLKHKELRYMACCKDSNFCNEDLPDPNELDDPRWKFEERADPDSNKSILAGGELLFVLIALLTFLYNCNYFYSPYQNYNLQILLPQH